MVRLNEYTNNISWWRTESRGFEYIIIFPWNQTIDYHPLDLRLRWIHKDATNSLVHISSVCSLVFVYSTLRNWFGPLISDLNQQHLRLTCFVIAVNFGNSTMVIYDMLPLYKVYWRPDSGIPKLRIEFNYLIRLTKVVISIVD